QNIAGGFRPAAGQPLVSRWSAALRQPAGEEPCKRLTHALDSARTFGAEHRRGLPPSRWSAAGQPHGGSLRAKGPANVLPTHSTASAPSVRNIAGGFRPAARQPAGRQ
ncbi:MAG: hypothetical protein ACKO2L_06865, partial [Planctomycetaceae bacterium]